MAQNPDHIKSTVGEEKPLEKSLEVLVDNSRNSSHLDSQSQCQPDAVNTTHHSKARGWISKLWPSQETVEKLFAYEHLGNYVIDRSTGKKIFESMPIYVRVGMHLLFCNGRALDNYASVEDLLMKQSIKQGKLYDEEGETVKPHIEAFIKTYDLSLTELLEQDLNKYPTFNAFFSRKLQPSARPIAKQDDQSVLVSPADCRMTVFDSIDLAKKFWVKGKEFSVPELLGHDERFNSIQEKGEPMLIISRLAPQDYHRFHCPCDATVVSVLDIPGQLYTVNPQAVNEDLNVFTKNKRSVMLLKANFGPGKEEVPMAFVAIGAMLVGSIGWSAKEGDKLKKGDELGWFQYGGSTCIVVLPSPQTTGLKFDQDLSEHSGQSLETVVSMGMQVATVQS